MSIQTALVAIKTANVALNALIGTGFHPDVLPQWKPTEQAITAYLPKLRFQVISRPNFNAMGPGIVDYRARVQMDGYATTSALRTTLRSAIKGAFYGYSGTVGGETIKAILLDNEFEGVELLDTNTQAYRITMDFIVDLA